ncbi:MAG: Nitrate reductase [Actinomycetia bacterium]|nr:Nitrate reductase [Actinomycetes bacterium]
MTVQQTKAISICRLCTAGCPVEVTIEEGRAMKVVGDRASDNYRGYSCSKGRGLPDLHNRADRLLQSQKRQPDGSYAPVDVDVAIDEIAEKVRAIVDEHGPRAIGAYMGTRVGDHPAMGQAGPGFMLALGSPMRFSALTLDQPGDLVARAFHGTWMGGDTRLEDTDTWVLVGTNPIVSHQYFANNPVGRITTAVRNGCRLVVIDPRATETSKHAAIHIQPRPGEDVTILAGLLALLFAWDALDHEFVAENVVGIDELRATVAPYTPEYVSARADVPAEQLIAAARIIADAKKGGIFCGTGAAMSNMGGNLAFYLGLAMHSLRGWWAREGDPFLRPNALLPTRPSKAQPQNPFPVAGFGEKLRIRGLEGGIYGIPGAAIFDEILTPGPGRVRALFNMGGNPLMAIPETSRAHEALRSLELYVTTDVSLSNNARDADYVIAVTMELETAALSYSAEALTHMHRGMGIEEPYAHYAPAAVPPPPGSQLIDDWQLYYRLAQKLGLQLNVITACGLPGAWDVAPIVHPLDMEREPTTDELFEIICADGRVPFDLVKQHEHGHVFEAARVVVGPRDPECDEHLDVGSDFMMCELDEHRRGHDPSVVAEADAAYPFLLIPRRDKGFVNGTGQMVAKNLAKRSYNPAYLHPDDLGALGLDDGDVVTIRSAHGSLVGVVGSDPTLKRGVLSMSHGFGGSPADDADPLGRGANTNQLLSLTAEFDRYTGMPRMGAVPVSIARAARGADQVRS